MTLKQQLFLTKKALNLYEYPVFSGSEISQDVSFEFEKWKERLDRGHDKTFEKRLYMQGLELKDAPGLFSLTGINKAADWVKELDKILALMPADPKEMLLRLKYDPISGCLDFYEYLSPILFYIEQKLLSVLMTDILSENARMDIMKSFFELVKFIFDRFGVQELNKMAGTILPQPIENLSEYYEAFCCEMLNNGFQKAFWEYPCLGRGLIESVGLQINFIGELITYLVNDKPCNGIITGFKFSAGDTHNYGRSVVVVEYDCGTKIVYKPQNGEVINAYGRLIDFLRESNIICHMKYPKVIASYPDHCYVEFIEHKPITDKINGADNYYYRIGQLTCLFYSLGTEDMHYENIIAHGEYPVAVDLETLLTAKVKSFINVQGDKKKKSEINEMVTRSIMLTVGGSYGGAALHPNNNYKNIPYYEDNSAIDFMSSCKNIIKGFNDAYTKIKSNKDVIIHKLSLFRNCRFRSIIRATQTYSDMLRHIYYTEYLKNGLLRSFETERFFMAYNNCDNMEQLKNMYPVFEEECRAVLRGDFPIFFVKADGLTILSTEQELDPGFFELSPIDHAKAVLEKMSNEDLEVQNKIIEMVLRSIEKKDFSAFTVSKKDVPCLTNSELINETQKIAETVIQHRIIAEGEEYFLTVYTAMEGNQKGRNSICTADNCLYSGTLGFALFFGALYSVTRNHEYKKSAVRIIESAYDEFISMDPNTNAGVSDGAGGFALVLYYLSEYLDIERYKEMARKIIALPLDFHAIEKTDYLGGLSGYIIAAHKINADTEYIEQAADRLTRLQVPYKDFNVWKSGISKKPLIGMGHGLSGIALAFAAAYNALHKEEYLCCALNALEYESNFYNKEKGWPDLRDDHSGYMSGFCSGAPGVGLARMSMLGISEKSDRLITEDIKNAIRHTNECSMGIKDDLCCGNSSGIDLLITAGEKYNNNMFLLEARRRLSWMVARKNAVGIYGNDTKSNLESIGFFNGICGVGYEMLRLVSNKIKGIF